MKLSIIIPAYNVERYIEKTLRSILCQNISMDDIEIIVVIDGSPDNTQSVVQRIINEGHPIKLIVQENQGLSMARNNGMKACSGEFVWFVDSDDWLPKGSIAEIVKFIDNDTDEIDFGALEISDDENTVISHKAYTKGAPNFCMSGLDIWLKKHPHIATAQLSVYRRAFLLKNNLIFLKGIYHEDYEFCPRASLLSRKTMVINKPLYMQRVNPMGITHTINPRKSYDYITVVKSLCFFIKNQNVPNVIKRRFYYFIAMAVNNSLDNMKMCSQNEVAKFNYYLKKKNIFIYFFMCYNLKYIIEAICFCFSAGKYVQTYTSLKKIVGRYL